MSLTNADLERYSRQLVLPEWSVRAQGKLAAARVGVIGAGALGSPVALYLAGAGVGTVGIVDPDAVEVHNLHRQILHFTPDVGVPKAHSAAAKLRFQNPQIVVEAYQVEVNATNAAILLSDFDVIVDCTDSFAARYAINQACCTLARGLVEGAVTGFEGLVMPIVPGQTACYRCAFPTEPPEGSMPTTCAEQGVLGPSAGVVGSLMALETLKLCAGLDSEVRGGFLQVDLMAPSILRVDTSRRSDCPDCGSLSQPV